MSLGKPIILLIKMWEGLAGNLKTITSPLESFSWFEQYVLPHNLFTKTTSPLRTEGVMDSDDI